MICLSSHIDKYIDVKICYTINTTWLKFCLGHNATKNYIELSTYLLLPLLYNGKGTGIKVFYQCSPFDWEDRLSFSLFILRSLSSSNIRLKKKKKHLLVGIHPTSIYQISMLLSLWNLNKNYWNEGDGAKWWYHLAHFETCNGCGLWQQTARFWNLMSFY